MIKKFLMNNLVYNNKVDKMNAFKILYFLWLIFHVSALIVSGWFSRITFRKGVSWSEFNWLLKQVLSLSDFGYF